MVIQKIKDPIPLTLSAYPPRIIVVMATRAGKRDTRMEKNPFVQAHAKEG